MSVYMWCKKN